MHASLVQQHNKVHVVTEKREEREREGEEEGERKRGMFTLKDQSG